MVHPSNLSLENKETGGNIFFFLKGALAEVQLKGPDLLFTEADYKLANEVLRGCWKAKEYHDQAEGNKMKWLEKKMYETQTGDIGASGPSVKWNDPY